MPLRRPGSPIAIRSAIEERRKHPRLTPQRRPWSKETGRSAYFAAGKEVALVVVDPLTAQGPRSVDRISGGLEDGPRLLRRLRPQARRALRLPAALRALLVGLYRLAATLAGRQPRPPRPARLRRLALLLQPGRNRRLGAARSTRRCSTCSAERLWIGFRGRGEGLRPVWPAAWLLIAALFLIGFRVGLNVADSGAIDVGYAGVVGADRIAHGEPIYGNFPERTSPRGTPMARSTTTPTFPSSGSGPGPAAGTTFPPPTPPPSSSTSPPSVCCSCSASASAPGQQGRKLAATLAFGWAAYPYTAFALESNSNDTLVALLLVATLLVLAARWLAARWLPWRPSPSSHPLLLVPMLVTYRPREVDREVAPGSGRVAAAGDGDPSRSGARRTLRTGALFLALLRAVRSS